MQRNVLRAMSVEPALFFIIRFASHFSVLMFHWFLRLWLLTTTDLAHISQRVILMTILFWGKYWRSSFNCRWTEYVKYPNQCLPCILSGSYGLLHFKTVTKAIQKHLLFPSHDMSDHVYWRSWQTYTTKLCEKEKKNSIVVFDVVNVVPA